METFQVRQKEKLNLLLSQVQRQGERDEFVYGVTNRLGRSFFKRINDFFIDHSGVPAKEKAYFYESLGTMLQAGIPINRALKILASKTENQRLKRVVSTIAFELERGKQLSAALDRFADIFPDHERGVIQSAEATGNLEHVAFKIADNLERSGELAMRLKAAFMYPVAVSIVLAVSFTILLVSVVPRIKEIFSQSSVALPLPTQILLNASAFLVGAWWLILIILIFGAIGFHVYINSEEGRFIWDFKKLRLPVVGPLLRKIFVLRFLTTFGLLVESGLPIDRALSFVAASIGNEVYRVKTYEAIAYVQEGQKLSASLARAPFLFPESVVNMISVGEHAASLGDISQKIGAQFQREIDYTLRNMTTVLGPILILAIGVAVVFFALAVLSPIFSLTQAIQ